MKKNDWIFVFPLILALTAIASFLSINNPEFYYRDSIIIAVKSHNLDLINLCIIVPIGLFMFIKARRRSYGAELFILGIMAYLAFMFGFNALSLHFNELFLIYTALFSLNVYGIIFGFAHVKRSGNYREKSKKIIFSAIFLLLFAVTAYSAWLIEIVSSIIHNLIPESITGMGLPVSVVHVFDLVFALPAIVIGAFLLLKGKTSGLIISSIMVTFVFFVCIGQLGMELALLFQGFHVDEGILYSMYILTPLSVFPMLTLFKALSSIDKNQLSYR